MHDWLMVINSNGRYSTILYTIICIQKIVICNVNVQYAMLLQYYANLISCGVVVSDLSFI